MDVSKLLDLEVIYSLCSVLDCMMVSYSRHLHSTIGRITQKRTGVKDTDIDDFLEKAAAVEAAVLGLKNGTIDPNNMPRIAGIETDEEKAEKEVRRTS